MRNSNASILFMARKYLAARSRFGIGSGHIFTLLGISLGVMALITVSSVMNGFRDDISGRIIGTLSEMRLSHEDGSPIQDYHKVVEQIRQQGYNAAPVVRNELLISYASEAVPAVCFGIDPLLQPMVSPVLRTSISGEGILAGSIDPGTFNEGGIAMGAALAQTLGVYIGDEVRLISPNFNIPTAFGLLPRMQKLKVHAIFSGGMPEYDQSFCYIPLPVARLFSSYIDAVDYIEIRSGEPDRSKAHVHRLAPQFPGFKLEDWSSFDASLYSAIRFEKFLMFVILLFMFIIASFNLTGSLLKLISGKKRELGLLKAMGYEDRDLKRLFLYQGLMLCTLGIIVGILLAGILLLIQDHTGLVKLADYIVLPVKMQVADFMVVIIVSYILTILSIQLPLRRLKSINAVELIQRNV